MQGVRGHWQHTVPRVWRSPPSFRPLHKVW